MRLSPQWGRIKTLIAEGAIGEPQHVNVALFRFPYRQGSGGWRYDRSRVGSWILEEPIHFFDLDPLVPLGRGAPGARRAIGTGDADMSAALSVQLRFPNGATAAVNQVLGGFEHHQVVEVVGSGGAIRSLWSGVMDRTFEPTANLRLKRAGRRLRGDPDRALRRGVRARSAGASGGRGVPLGKADRVSRGGPGGGRRLPCSRALRARRWIAIVVD